MQAQLDSIPTATRIQILGVNAVGAESGNEAMCEGRVLPWLQDSTSTNVWGLWNVTYRDVVVLSADNVKIAVFNLTTYDLADSANYAALEKILLDAGRSHLPTTNFSASFASPVSSLTK
jgi:hypothetical protein